MRRIAELLAVALVGALVAIGVEHAGDLRNGVSTTRIEVIGDTEWTASLGSTYGMSKSGEYESPDIMRASGRHDYALAKGNSLALLFSGHEEGGATYPAHLTLRTRRPWSLPGPWVTIQVDDQATVMVSDTLIVGS